MCTLGGFSKPAPAKRMLHQPNEFCGNADASCRHSEPSSIRCQSAGSSIPGRHLKQLQVLPGLGSNPRPCSERFKCPSTDNCRRLGEQSPWRTKSQTGLQGLQAQRQGFHLESEVDTDIATCSWMTDNPETGPLPRGTAGLCKHPARFIKCILLGRQAFP